MHTSLHTALDGMTPWGADHLDPASLLCRKHADVVVASIYVNPTQFSANEDFDVYPRDPVRQWGVLLGGAACLSSTQALSAYGGKPAIDCQNRLQMPSPQMQGTTTTEEQQQTSTSPRPTAL